MVKLWKKHVLATAWLHHICPVLLCCSSSLKTSNQQYSRYNLLYISLKCHSKDLVSLERKLIPGGSNKSVAAKHEFVMRFMCWTNIYNIITHLKWSILCAVGFLHNQCKAFWIHTFLLITSQLFHFYILKMTIYCIQCKLSWQCGNIWAKMTVWYHFIVIKNESESDLKDCYQT